MAAAIIPRPGFLTLTRNLVEIYSAVDPADRETVVDLALTDPQPRWSITLELDTRTTENSAPWDRGYLIVGVVGDIGAALWHRAIGPGVDDVVATATSGDDPSTLRSEVILDDEGDIYFRRNRLVPKDVLRSIMAEYALTGSVEITARLTPFDYDRDPFQVPLPPIIRPTTANGNAVILF